MKRVLGAAVLFVFITTSLNLISCSSSHQGQKWRKRYYKSSYHKRGRFATKRWKTKKRLKSIQSDVPLEMNDRVYAWIDYFTGANRERFKRYLYRSGHYMEMMRETLKKHGLPEDLVYIALIESGFSNNAHSRSHAVGCWQFIRSTARRYNLNINEVVDERRDPVKATVAAARYLKDLYEEFGDWYLAMAAYNAGEGSIRRAVAATGSKDFWVLAESRHSGLKAETRDYVPKFIAAAVIAKQPKKFGFHDVDYGKPFVYETAKVDSQTDLEVIAKCAGVNIDEIKRLNPELIRGVTPPYDYEIKLPPGKRERFKVALAKIPPHERISNIIYVVKRHDTLSKISRKFGVPTGVLIAANNLKSTRRLKKGQVLKIPRRGAAVTYAKGRGPSYKASGPPKGRTEVVQYQVRSGDTLGGIAKRFKVTIAEMKRWNNIGKNNVIKRGQILKIYRGRDVAGLSEIVEPVREKMELASAETKKTRDMSSDGSGGAVQPAEKKTHIIKKGETLSVLAKRYGVSVNDLRRWNNIPPKGNIYAGKELIIYGEGVSKVVKAKRSASDRLPMKRMGSGDKALVDKSNVKSGIKGAILYKVKRGDTVWDIARKNNIPYKKLIEINKLGPKAKIKPGDVLKVSAR